MGKRRKLKKQGVLILTAAAAVIILVPAVIISSCVRSRPEPQPPVQTETLVSVSTPEPSPSPEATPAVSEEPIPYETTESSITTKTKYIYGKTYIPQDGKETHPVVIVCHGIGVNLNHTENFAMMFAERGIAAYAFDFCGGGDTSRSSGTMMEMSVHTERDDLFDAIDHVKNIGIAGDNPIIVLGMSQGGYVAAEAAAQRPDEIAGLILFFPAFNINDLIFANFSSPEEVPESVTIFDQTVSRKYFTDAMSEPITQDMESYRKPVLILHGSEDDVVLPSYSEDAAKHYPNAEFHLIEGAGHGFFLQDAETAMSFCMPYVQKILRSQG